MGLADKEAYPFSFRRTAAASFHCPWACMRIRRSILMNLHPHLIRTDRGDPEGYQGSAQEHITMVIVTHEMNFARDISDRIILWIWKGSQWSERCRSVFSSENENEGTFKNSIRVWSNKRLLLKSQCYIISRGVN